MQPAGKRTEEEGTGGMRVRGWTGGRRLEGQPLEHFPAAYRRESY